MEALLATLGTAANILLKFEINLKKTPRDRRTAAFVTSRMAVLEQYWNHFLASYLKFRQLPEAESSDYVTNDTFSEVQECYLDAKTILTEWAPRAHPTGPQAPQQPQGGQTPAVQITGRLPKLDLLQFSGEIREWETFRDLFRAMVHEHQGLSPAVKLQYLKMNITGEAAQLIRNVAVSNANDHDAWQSIVARYDNPRILVQTHVRALHSFTGVSKESASGIRRLLDGTNECVRALKNLGQPVQHWDAIVIDLTCQRLDHQSRRDWETSLGDSRMFPTWVQLSTFLETRVRALDAARPTTTTSGPTHAAASSSSKPQKTNVSSHTVSTKPHYIGFCPQYKAQELPQCEDQIRRLRLCRNCLGQGHLAAACPSPKKCNVCAASHHTSLHGTGQRPTAKQETVTPTAVTSTTGGSGESAIQTHHASTSSPRSRTVLLGTALVSLASETGRRVTARILIDPCSEGCFASEAKAQALRAPRTAALVPVSGVAGAKVGVSKSVVTIVVGSRSDPSINISVVACILPRVTSDLPSRAVPRLEWSHVAGLPLADPEFERPGKIDMILGADVYHELLLSGVRFGAPGTPLAQETIFGWILTGPVSSGPAKPIRQHRGVHVHHCRVDNDLSQFVSKFWELDDLPARHHLTEEEEKCEKLFRESHRRDEMGRYIVRLPFRADPAENLGESRSFACRALARGERRRESDPKLEAEYSRFLSEYLSLGHMEPASVLSTADRALGYYMPHHSVAREVEGAMKIRVVFNASHPASSGKPLNDFLLPGPKLQVDIMTILLQWRRHRIVFAADIVKMFRQIRVADEDSDYQRIVWRESTNSPVRDYRLSTVTYGTACAPYLAIRTLQQLAKDEAHRFPAAAHVVRYDTYVDDTLTGADDLHTARELKRSLTDLMKSGGFELSKWMSNSHELLTDTLDRDLPSPSSRNFDSQEWVRTLGVVWTPVDDFFRVKPNLDCSIATATKRTLLSNLARTFDPLGWIAPVLITGKILFQDSWISGVSWDDSLPTTIQTAWLNLRAALPRLEDLAIPRWLGPTTQPRRYQLHGFSDANGLAQSSSRTPSSGRPRHSALAWSHHSTASVPTPRVLGCIRACIRRSSVAPVKSVSLPRLELCGAVLLARLMTFVKETLQDDLADESFAWSDSTVTLAWIRGHPSRWVTFVANRVAEIHNLLPNTAWQHVKSADNPADLATRGIMPEQLLQAELWWQGPDWLQQSSENWPRRAGASVEATDLEARVERRVHVTDIRADNDVLTRFSRLHRLLRVTAWCLRVRQSKNHDNRDAQGNFRPLCADEIASARQRWIIITQTDAFPDEIAALQSAKPLPRRSALIRLNPFLDNQGVLRLGGRLQGAMLTYGERHPAILPGTSHFTELLIRQAHEATLHGGPQLTLSYLLRSCWILGGRNKIRSMVHRCVECTRHRAATPHQQMGQLPIARTTRPSRPFGRTGLDYAGPFLIRASAGRGRTTIKAYIALFICLATRAIHFEVVGSYSTTSFLAAFKRFSTRRGICSELHSDNGTNFRGADHELRAMFRAASSTSREIAAALTNDGTQWHFIPPNAPHFGGLWEAGVKSTKYHLRRVIGETKMTYEEFTTVVTQIEGCLNSRPLCPLSSDPSDLVALTPGHFLCGCAPTAPPEPTTHHLPLGRLTRWQLTSHMVESFWRRWSSEYLNHLQQRNKWTTPSSNIKIGDSVLLRTHLLPPAKWPLARVIETHPGPDGLTRVVTVKTAASTFKRPIVKLVLLPVQEPRPTPDFFPE